MFHKIPDWFAFAVMCVLFGLVAARLILGFALG
ncbi:hypothetical protein J2T08_002990 [Neorhizobium galegae]|nr:hypothetical protein [Neorhizobium galegae]